MSRQRQQAAPRSINRELIALEQRLENIKEAPYRITFYEHQDKLGTELLDERAKYIATLDEVELNIRMVTEELQKETADRHYGGAALVLYNTLRLLQHA